MSKQRVRNKIYALIITVTLFMSVNNLSEAEEKSTVAGMELADNAGRISSREELDNDDRISDIKSRYTTEEVELGNELSSKKAKKNRRNSARQAAKGKGKTNNVFEADRETKHDLKVGSIEFSNLKELSPDLLLSKIPVKSGDSYTNKKLSDIYLSLKRLGYISEANVYPKIRGNTVNIMVEVAEVENASAIIQRKQMQEEMKKETEYTVASIDIEGLQTRRKEEYLKNLPIKPGDIFVPQKAVDGAQKIFDSGYFSTVEPKIDRKADNTVSIVYEV